MCTTYARCLGVLVCALYYVCMLCTEIRPNLPFVSIIIVCVRVFPVCIVYSSDIYVLGGGGGGAISLPYTRYARRYFRKHSFYFSGHSTE